MSAATAGSGAEVPGAACEHCGLPVAGRRPAADGAPAFCCLGCSFAHHLARPAARDGGPVNTLLLRLGLGIFLALNVMVASWLGYSRELFGAAATAQGSDRLLPELFAYFALFLSTILLLLLGGPILRDALRPWRATVADRGARGALVSGVSGSHLLVVIGVVSAYGLSALHTVRGAGSLYFDTAAMVLVAVTLGSHLEAGAKRRAASAASRLLATLPDTVTVARPGAVDGLAEIPLAELRVGDRVRVLAGEAVPVDGEVERGASRLDESSLRGESRPRTVGPGDRLLAGSINLDGQLWARAETVGEGTVLALLERSLAEARARRPALQRIADRVAAFFVPAVVALALGVFAAQAWRGALAEGILRGLSVLLISCPCALGLAAPLACWHGLRRAARRGILFDGPETIERAARVDRLFFDKTGTLTLPVAALRSTVTAPGLARGEALRLAASLESSSPHPIARGLLAAARAAGVAVTSPEAARTVAGRGVEGRLDGRLLRLGSPRWARELGVEISLAGDDADDRLAVLLMEEGRVLARFELGEELRPDAASALAELRRMGVDLAILSGDRADATRRLGERLGLPAAGGLLPEEKVARLAEARAEARHGSRSGRVAMVGDGLNDAPVLAAADVGIALASASELAASSGNVRLTADRLAAVPQTLAIARSVRRRIALNLAWAFGFNGIGLALAAAGRLSPVFAAIAMVLSSLVVVKISSGAGRLADEERGERAAALTPRVAARQPALESRG